MKIKHEELLWRKKTIGYIESEFHEAYIIVVIIYIKPIWFYKYIMFSVQMRKYATMP